MPKAKKKVVSKVKGGGKAKKVAKRK